MPLILDDEVRILQGTRFLCRVGFEVIAATDDKRQIVRVHLGKKDSPIIETGLPFDVLPFDVDLKATLKIWDSPNFRLWPQMQGSGVGRYIWHRIYHYYPKDFWAKFLLRGTLSSVDEGKDMGARRDRLWKDVCGFTSNHPKSTFVPQTGNNDGWFIGPLHDPWDPERSSLRIVKVSDDTQFRTHQKRIVQC